MLDYAKVFDNPEAVLRYTQVEYAPGGYAWWVDRRQRAWLRRFAMLAYRSAPVQHDFACGTGRLLRSLSGVVRLAYGYDSSAAMLAEARAARTGAELFHVAASGAVPEPADAPGPTLVTAFRLLLNAAPAVRDRALVFAGRALPAADSGYLVLENHGNRNSLRHLARWHRGGSRWFAELSTAEVTELLDRHGFELVSTHGFALLPRGLYRIPVLRTAARAVDDWASRRRWLAKVSVNVVYVAKRKAG